MAGRGAGYQEQAAEKPSSGTSTLADPIPELRVGKVLGRGGHGDPQINNSICAPFHIYIYSNPIQETFYIITVKSFQQHIIMSARGPS